MAPIDDSEVTSSVPISAEVPTWVPPQNSTEKSPTETTRTCSPYLSPKKASAPMASASSLEVSSVPTPWLLSTLRLTNASTSASSSGDTPWKWLKSKRSRPSSTNDPAWLA